MASATTTPVVEVLQQVEPVIVAPTTQRARVKGTWTMYYGGSTYDFVDGQYTDIPTDLFEYLRQRGNIYDTMA